MSDEQKLPESVDNKEESVGDRRLRLYRDFDMKKMAALQAVVNAVVDLIHYQTKFDQALKELNASSTSASEPKSE